VERIRGSEGREGREEREGRVYCLGELKILATALVKREQAIQRL